MQRPPPQQFFVGNPSPTGVPHYAIQAIYPDTHRRSDVGPRWRRRRVRRCRRRHCDRGMPISADGRGGNDMLLGGEGDVSPIRRLYAGFSTSGSLAASVATHPVPIWSAAFSLSRIRVSAAPRQAATTFLMAVRVTTLSSVKPTCSLLLSRTAVVKLRSSAAAATMSWRATLWTSCPPLEQRARRQQQHLGGRRQDARRRFPAGDTSLGGNDQLFGGAVIDTMAGSGDDLLLGEVARLALTSAMAGCPERRQRNDS